ncbi:MAG TPA: hypothetical protein VFY29_04370 [Terriglobia bacterium]|nr:hypothetical protein [Terriglobia bacterium]
MKSMIRIVALLGAVSVSFTPIPAKAAQQGAKTPKGEAKSLLPVPKNKQEEAAYNEILNQSDPAGILQSSQTFIEKYSTSPMMGKVYGRRMDAYLAANKFAEALDELEKVLAFNSKYLSDRTKEAEDKKSPLLAELQAANELDELNYYRRIVDAAQGSNKVEVANFFGERILQKIPNDFPTLLTVARLNAQNPPKADKEKEEALDRAEMMGQLAVNYVVAVLNGPNRDRITPEQKNEWSYRAHSLMGLIYNQQKHYEDAVKAYLVALDYKNNDGATYYYLGFAYYAQMKYEEAFDVILKSAFLKGPMEKYAREMLDQLYVATKRDKATMEKDIQAAGERIGKS